MICNTRIAGQMLTFQICNFADIDNARRQEITSFLDSQETSHPFQFPEWARTKNSCALLHENGKLQWFACIGKLSVFGRDLRWFRSASINRGPVCDRPELWHTGLSKLAQHLAKQNYCYLDVGAQRVVRETDTGLFGEGWYKVSAPGFSLRLDLTRDEDALFSNFRKVARYEVRRAERMGVEVTQPECQAETESFLRVYSQMAERKAFAPDPPDHVQNIIRWLQNDTKRGALLVAKRNRKVLGGAIIVRAGRRCWYVWGASQKHGDLSSGHLVQWEALRWAKSHGCTEYDFGGYTPGARSGPAWFKEGFGGSVVQFAPVHRRVLGSGVYGLLRLLRRVG